MLRKIPSVNRILEDIGKEWSSSFFVREVRLHLSSLRKDIQKGVFHPELQDYRCLLNQIKKRLHDAAKPKICRAFNATGVILHTGLGRAVLPSEAIHNICEQLKGFSVVEIDRDTGKRSQRDKPLRQLLTSLTGAEDATVVNNNAGAVLLTLATLACGKEVIVSRGQLVEIGGSFRIPDVMRQSGAHLVEIGCTNKTYLSDYEDAINEKTAAILQVHTSNYEIVGFSEEVSINHLAKLAHRKKIFCIQDAGSGAIGNYFPWGLGREPMISESIAQGVDVLTFSGDKLLGSCQAGIIVGKASLIQKIRSHPLARALRVDKIP